LGAEVLCRAGRRAGTHLRDPASGSLART
jgi:hypothetical protein